MKKFLLRFFTWWNGQTFGTQLWTRLYGEFVGKDEFGNRYYRTAAARSTPRSPGAAVGDLPGIAEASTMPPTLARLDAPHR